MDPSFSSSSPSSSSGHAELTVTVTHRRQPHTLTLAPHTPLSALHAQLAELTGIPPENQKLLYKGKQPASSPDATLEDAGLRAGARVTLLGATAAEVGGLHKAEDERRRREQIMAERAARGTPKVRATGPATPPASAQYRVHRIEPLAHLPAPDTARATLARLAADPAIQYVMRAHRLAVGLLTELAPHEAPHLLGLNENAGQAVRLRIRTDRYDGFRSYAEVRRVLCHELTHNVWGDHDDNFKAMNSQLNREVAEFERAAREGAHTLSAPGAYEPAGAGADGALAAEARAYVLGGAGAATPRAGESAEERRRRVLEATMRRLRREEEELEQSCGTAPTPHAPGQPQV